jgi:hypothetical protein
MGRTNASLLAFNRGEVAKLALARVDLERMRLSAETQVNWMPTVLGPMMLRPGTQARRRRPQRSGNRYPPVHLLQQRRRCWN